MNNSKAALAMAQESISWLNTNGMAAREALDLSYNLNNLQLTLSPLVRKVTNKTILDIRITVSGHKNYHYY